MKRPAERRFAFPQALPATRNSTNITKDVISARVVGLLVKYSPKDVETVSRATKLRTEMGYNDQGLRAMSVKLDQISKEYNGAVIGPDEAVDCETVGDVVDLVWSAIP